MAFLGEIHDSPHKTAIGDIFIWHGQMWRRGRGILYRARPNLRIRQKFYRGRPIGRPTPRLRRNTSYIMGWRSTKG
jgi:hypothetical protein